MAIDLGTLATTLELNNRASSGLLAFTRELEAVSQRAQAVTSYLAETTNAYSGAKAFAEAERAVKALDAIGDVAKLTSDEQRAMAETVTAAIAKYHVMGKDVPADVLRVSSALERVQQEQERIAQGAKTLADAEKRTAQAALEAAAAQKKAADEAAAAQQRVTASLSGQTIQQEASRIVKAIESIGGVSKLTAAEQRQVNTVVTDAIAKYRALGTAAPPELLKIAEQTTVVESRTAGLGRAVTALAAPLAAAGGASVKFATDLNASMANVSTLIPENRQRIDEFKGSIQELAVQTGKSTKDLSGGLYEVISSIGDTGDTLKILEINAKAGAAGLATTTEALGFTSAVTKTYGDTSAEAFQKVADLGFQAVNIGQTTFPQLAAAIGGVAPLAKETGISLEEMFAVLATATGVTGNTNEVVTQMSSAITALVSPSKELKDLYDQLGVKSGEALIKQEGLVGALQKVAEGARAADTPLIDLLGRKEAWIIASSLAGAQAEKFSDNLRAMGDVAGETDRAFVKQTQGINKAGFEYEQWKQRVVTSMQQAGDAILGSLPGPLKVVAVALSESGSRALSMAGELSQVAIAARLLGGAQGLSGLLGPLGRAVGLTRDLDSAARGAAAATTALGASSGAAAAGGVMALARSLGVLGLALGGLYAMKELAANSIAARIALEAIPNPIATLVGKWADLSSELDGAALKTKRQAEVTATLASLQAAGIRPLSSHTAATTEGAGVAERAARATLSFAEQLTKTQVQVAGLNIEQREAIKAGNAMNKSTEQVLAEVNRLGKGVNVTKEVIELYEATQKSATKAIKDHASELKKAEAEHQEYVRSIGAANTANTRFWEDYWSAQQAAMVKSSQGIVRNLEIKKQAEENAAAISRQLTMGELEFKLDAIVREGEARKRMVEGTSELAQQARETIDAEVALSLQALIVKSQEFRTQIAGVIAAILAIPMPVVLQNLNKEMDQATEKTTTWRTGLGQLAQSFTNLAQVSGGALSSVARGIGSILNTMELGAKAGEQFMEGLKSAFASGNKNWGAITSNIAAGLLGGIGAMAAATDPMKGTFERVIGGAATGAAMGGAAAMAATWAGVASKTGQIYIVAAAAIAGAFIGYFRGRAVRREMEVVGKEWGQDITQGFMKQIQSIQRSEGLGRVEASLFLMSDFISEAGGLNAVNFDRFLGKLRDVFSAFETGAFTATQATHVLNENFGTFAQHVVESGRLASTAFQEILALNAAQGLYAQEVLTFVSQRTAVVAEGLSAMAGPLLAEIELFKKGMEDGKVSAEQQAKFTAASAAEIDNLGIIALGAFGAARKAGLSYYEALQAIGPGLDALIKAQEDLGITAEHTGLQQLVHFRDMTNANQTLVKSAEALNATMLGLSQIGGLNAETLAAMEQQGLTTFGRLIEAGFTENEALALMADYLNTVAEAHLQLGIPIDENTGRLIEQADQLGLLSKDGESMTKTLKNGFDSVVGAINAMILTLGGIPYQVQSIGDAIKKLPNKIPLEFEVPKMPKMPMGEDLPQYRFGSGGLRNFGAGTVVELHGHEAVVPEDEYTRLMSAAPRVLQGEGGRLADLTGGDTYMVSIDNRGAFVGDYASQQRFAQMVDDVLVGRVGGQRQIGLGRAA